MGVLKGPLRRARTPSHRGSYYVREWRGQLVVSRWPRRRSRPLPQKTRDQIEWFRQANLLAKYVIAEQQVLAREITAGTPLLPRDLLIAAMAGRLYSATLDDGRTIYSMAAANDVSQNLDIIAQAPGDILVRGPTAWTRVPAAEAGRILTAQGPAALPEWRANPPFVRLLKTTGQLVLGGQETVLTWASIDEDDGGWFDPAEPTLITVPSPVSRILIAAGARSDDVTTGEFAVFIRRVGATKVAMNQTLTDGAATTEVFSFFQNTSPGDRFEVGVFTDLDRNISASALTFFSAAMVGSL